MSLALSPKTGRNPVRPKVLIVEDERSWQLTLERTLRKLNPRLSFSFTTNANQAFSLIRSNGYDFIVADYRLKGPRTGLDLWDSLEQEGIEIPFVLISGKTRAEFYDNLEPFRLKQVPVFIEKCTDILRIRDSLARFIETQRPQKKPASQALSALETKFAIFLLLVGFLGICPRDLSVEPTFLPFETLASLSSPGLSGLEAYREELRNGKVSPKISAVISEETLGSIEDLINDRSILSNR